MRHPVGLAAAGMDLGVDDAGAHRIDADAFGGQLFGQPQGKGVDGALAGRVVHILARRAQARCRAGQVDNRPALPAMTRAHAQHGFARADKAAQDVGVKHALEARHAHGVHPGRQVHNAGVVDQGGEAALLHTHMRVQLRKHRQHLGLVGHISLQGNGLATRCANALHNVGCSGRVAAVVDRHRVALPRRQHRHSGPDAAAAASDQKHFGVIFLQVVHVHIIGRISHGRLLQALVTPLTHCTAPIGRFAHTGVRSPL